MLYTAHAHVNEWNFDIVGVDSVDTFSYTDLTKWDSNIFSLVILGKIVNDVSENSHKIY